MRFLAFIIGLFTITIAFGQNPTILQGSYISNVFGNSNFVLNPNAQTNTANVTNATRSTTTPLVATSEFTLSLANGANATWTLRAFDQGMKGQNCEARFTYRGFATATTKAEIVQNSLVVAELTLTPSTDPRIASINFPCGDLVNATTFRIAQTTAAMTGTNEIGAVYVGLATNMANVAQAEMVGGGEWTASAVFSRSASAAQATYAAFTSGSGNTTTGTAIGKATTAGSDTTITFPYLPAGEYQVMTNLSLTLISQSQSGECKFSIQEIDSNTYNGQTFSGNVWTSGTIFTASSMLVGRFNFTSGGQRRFRIVSLNSAAGTNSSCQAITDTTSNKAGIYVYRFPSTSELVVTPERQNVWGGVVYDDSFQNLFFGTAEPTAFTSYNNATWNKPTKLKGKASVTTTNTGNDLGFSIDQLPVGNYKVTLTNGFYTAPGFTDGDNAICVFRVRETTTNTIIGRIQLQAVRMALSNVTQDGFGVIDGVFTQTSLGQRNFILEASKTADSTASNQGQCVAIANTSTPNMLSFTITPLDQPSNSALYVQGPVLASQTGAAIPSGYQSETQSSQGGFTVYTSNTPTTMTSLTLQPGVYMLIGQSIFGNNNLTGATGSIMAIGTTTNSFTGTTQGLSRLDGVAFQAMTLVHYVTVTSATTYYLVVQTTATSGNAQNIWGLRSIRLN